MTTPADDIAALRARIRVLEVELSRVRHQCLKAYKDRADIHARLRRLTPMPGCLPVLVDVSVRNERASRESP